MERAEDSHHRAEEADEGHHRAQRAQHPERCAQRLDHLAAGAVHRVGDAVGAGGAIEGRAVERRGSHVRPIALVQRDHRVAAEQRAHHLLVQLARLGGETLEEQGALHADHDGEHRPQEDGQLGDHHHRAAGLQQFEKLAHMACLTRKTVMFLPVI